MTFSNSETPSKNALEDEKSSILPAHTSADVESSVGDEKDTALAIVGEHRHAIDAAIEARVVRKIDWFLIPTMSIGYGLVYYDKVHTTPQVYISY
jgi:hypothetical protein